MFMRKRIFINLILLAAGLGALSTDIEAQQADRVYRLVLQSYGVENLRNHRFKPKPFCTPVPRTACTPITSRAQAAVKELLGAPHYAEGASFMLSPVRDSAGVLIVRMYVTQKSDVPGYLGATDFEFILNRQGTRVLSKKAVMSELIPVR